ncbi:hypothetical protein [Aminipila sp.]|uniref:hypothetical protein n=1 Tax=Aminipila sp. TaxID=2060095 RepID=UPI002896DA16|nr:hypothetical protein [Aminipila sp.]
MSFGLKVWLVIWSIVTIFYMAKSYMDPYNDRFLYNQIENYIFIFTPSCCVLFVSIYFQILKSFFKNIAVPCFIAIVTYFIVLIAALPYGFLGCLLAGLVVAPVGLFHYKLSVTFFGDIEF